MVPVSEHDEQGTELSGLVVLVTRPQDQAPPLVALLEARGATAIVMPLIEIIDLLVDPDAEQGLAAAIGSLGPDDWVVVASPNSAARLAPLLVDCAAHVAAIGATTTQRITRVRHIDLVPEQQNAAGLVEVFPHGDGAGRVLVAQAAEGAPTLVQGITARGWIVTRIDTHRASPLRPTSQQQFVALRADALLLTSGSQARAWTTAFGDASPPIVVAMGPQTASDAADAGLKVHAVAAEHSLAGSVEALVRHVRP